jgi:hypothetical protein
MAEGDFTLKLSTGEIILDAVRRVRDPDVVRYALGDLDRVLTLSNDPLLRFQRITLSPSDGYILSRIDGTLSTREVMQLLSLPGEEVQRSLFGLLCTGVVEHAPGPPKAAAKAIRPARPAPKPEPPRPAPAPVPTPVAAPAKPAPPSPRPKAWPSARRSCRPSRRCAPRATSRSSASSARRRKPRSRTPISDSPSASIPTPHHDPNMADLRDKLETVFIRPG